MNKVILIGRLARDPEVRYSQGSEGQFAIARFSVAVDRRGRRNQNSEEQSADFISCVAFRQQAELLEKYFKKGNRIGIVGHIQTGSYTNKDGQKVYTTDVMVDEIEFVESKGAQGGSTGYSNESQGSGFGSAASSDGGFMNIPDGVEDDLPFN